MSAGTVARRTVAPIVCAPWCEDGDGHGAALGRADQRCRSGWVKVTQTLEPQWESSRGHWHPTTVDVEAERGPLHPPGVVLYRITDREDVEMHLTASEARAVAANLLAAADLVDGAS